MAKLHFLQRVTNAAKEFDEMFLFAFFSNRVWFLFLDNSPLLYLMLPVIGVAFIINTAIDWIHYAQAKNKNITNTLGVLVMTFAAISINLAVVGRLALGASFMFGPYLFVGALGTLALYQLGCLAASLYKAINAPRQSVERAHYLQAASRHGLSFITAASITALIVIVMLTPVAPWIVMTVAAATVAITAVNFVWNVTPNKYRQLFKTKFGTQKPTPIEDNLISPAEKNQATHLVNYIGQKNAVPPRHDLHCFFKREYRAQKVKILMLHDKAMAKKYLSFSIQSKLDTLQAKTQDSDTNSLDKLIDKKDFKYHRAPNNLQKILALYELNQLLEKYTFERFNQNDKPVHEINALLEKYPAIAQSFFADVSDTQDIFDATRYYFGSTVIEQENIEHGDTFELKSLTDAR